MVTPISLGYSDSEMLYRVGLLLTLATISPVWGGLITMDFLVEMTWRYDLGTNATDPAFHPVTVGVQAVIDDQVKSRQSSAGATRISFDDVQITSTLPSVVNMGYDLSTLQYRYSDAWVQDNSSPSPATWTNFYDQIAANGANYNRNLGFTNDPALSDPANFGSADLRTLLASQIGKNYSYTENITFDGGGYYHSGSAKLLKVAFDSPGQPATSAVPEPSTYGSVAIAALALWKWKARKAVA